MPDLLSQIGSDGAIRDDLAESWGITDLRFYNTIPSTQKIARALAEAGAESWTVIVADHQTEGRGRGGNAWISQPGSSVMFSLVIRPERPEALPLLPIRIGLIIAEALDTLLVERGIPETDELPLISLKWPNDLVVAGGKVGGILVEATTRGEKGAAVIGVGLNVFRMTELPPPDREKLPLRYIDDLMKSRANRLHLLERLITSLRERLRTVPEDLMPREIEEYAERDWLRGRMVETLQGKVSESNGHQEGATLTGRVLGINRKGHLLVERENGEVEAIWNTSIGMKNEE